MVSIRKCQKDGDDSKQHGNPSGQGLLGSHPIQPWKVRGDLRHFCTERREGLLNRGWLLLEALEEQLKPMQVSVIAICQQTDTAFNRGVEAINSASGPTAFRAAHRDVLERDAGAGSEFNASRAKDHPAVVANERNVHGLKTSNRWCVQAGSLGWLRKRKCPRVVQPTGGVAPEVQAQARFQARAPEARFGTSPVPKTEEVQACPVIRSCPAQQANGRQHGEQGRWQRARALKGRSGLGTALQGLRQAPIPSARHS